MKTDHYYAAPKNYYTCCLALIYVSMVIVILDGIFGLDIFLTGSDRLSPIYRAAFFLKLVIVTFGIFIYSKIPGGLLFPLLVLILGLKLLFGLYFYSSVISLLGHAYFYIFILIGYIGGWQLARADLSRIIISSRRLTAVIWLVFLICVVYYIAVQIGIITYFGMGPQTYVLLAVLLSTKSSLVNHFLILMSVILTGKRSSALVYVGQLIGPKLSVRRRSLKSVVTGLLVFSLVLYLSYQVGIADRFQSVIDVFSEFDGSDLFANRDLLYIATSGRTEELFAYFLDQKISNMVWVFGQAAGYSFPITDWNGVTYDHYYFHIAPLNYIFHFGVPIGVLLIVYQFKLFIWSLKRVSSEKNIYCLLYIGYYLANWFGAISVIDLFFWVLFSYCHFYRGSLNKKKQSIINKLGDDLKVSRV